MPVLVRLQGLDEPLALGGGLGGVADEQASPFEDAVDAGGATGHHVGVEHHERQAAVAFRGELPVEVEDRLLLLGLQPLVARDPGVVLVGLAVAVLPRVPLGGGDAEPQQEVLVSGGKWRRSRVNGSDLQGSEAGRSPFQ
jgi:hypothetical protein